MVLGAWRVLAEGRGELGSPGSRGELARCGGKALAGLGGHGGDHAVDPGLHLRIPPGLVLASLEQAFELVSVTGAPGFWCRVWLLRALVLIDQCADVLSEVLREAGDLVSGDGLRRWGRDVGLADARNVADASFRDVMEQAEGRSPSGLAPSSTAIM